MLRPFREDFFAAFATQLQAIGMPATRVLELGAGPGFLAHFLLARIPKLHITLLERDGAYLMRDH
jgi:tRNA1(Val) A37 N6-methylase TrmN6